MVIKGASHFANFTHSSFLQSPALQWHVSQSNAKIIYKQKAFLIG